MKILLVEIGNVIGAQGGIEKVLANMANAMDNYGHEVVVMTFDKHSGDLFFPLHKSVRFVNLGEGIHISRTLINLQNVFYHDRNKKEWNRSYHVCKKMLPKIEQFIDKEKPDIIVCFEKHGVILFTDFIKPGIPVVAMFHSAPKIILQNNYFHPYFSKVNCLQVLLPKDIERVRQILPDAKNVVCIGNAVPQWQELVDYDNKKIITVSHVEPNVKRPHIIVEAFAEIAKKYSDWGLEIWGNDEYDVNYTKKIKTFIISHGLEQQVKLCGTTGNIKEKLYQASIFVTASKYEGFHLGLAEAMSAGLATIGFNNCSAVNELIKDGRNGFLCEDNIFDLAEKMETLILDKQLREKFGKQGKENMLQYAPDRIWKEWEILFEKFH